MRITGKSLSFLSLLLAMLFVVFRAAFTPQKPALPVALSPSVSPATILSRQAKVTRVVDGDTIEIATGQKVRYIGIDTPELHHPKKPVQCFGKEAREKNKELVEGKVVRLEKDVSETDQYGRLLRYVYLDTATSEAMFVNAYLVKQGYARASTFPPDVKYADLFLKLQTDALNNQLGLWSSCQ
ncbi:thermonuclease family protein [Candidatus Roizmanbacteria bacterium]|nr:thermonuclease family protein [Candidatus Roizmanbacteria bacterium]